MSITHWKFGASVPTFGVLPFGPLNWWERAYLILAVVSVLVALWFVVDLLRTMGRGSPWPIYATNIVVPALISVTLYEEAIHGADSGMLVFSLALLTFLVNGYYSRENESDGSQ